MIRTSINKKKVLEIVGGTFEASGSSLMMWKWYENFDLSNLQIDFYCLTQPRDYYTELIVRNKGKCFTRQHHKNRFFRDIIWIKSLHKIVRDNRYDCIHVHISNARIVLIIYLTCRKYVKKVIAHSHNTGIGSSWLKNLIHNLCKYLLSYSKITWVACSEDAAEWLVPLRIIKKRQYTIIKYGIEVQRFVYDEAIRKQIRKNLNLADHFVIGHVGRFVYQKNHSFLIDVFEQVYRKCSDAMLLLIGDKAPSEDLTTDIRNKVNALNLTDNVIFLGNIDNVCELYQAMDCFVLPSRYEGLGIVLIEAQAAGLKILCSDAVPREAKVTEDLKYMSLNISPERWAEELLSYNNHYERKNALRQIEEAGYGLKNSAKKIENLYFS